MESQPQNPEFRNNPENFHPCRCSFAKYIQNVTGQKIHIEIHRSIQGYSKVIFGAEFVQAPSRFRNKPKKFPIFKFDFFTNDF